MDGQDKNWPAWYNGPHGESRIFNSADEVPAGWTTGAEKAALKAAPSPPPSPSSPSPPPPVKSAGTAEIDADGHPWSADLHAASKGKTKAGLWRMAVGKARPAPLAGFPEPALDL